MDRRRFLLILASFGALVGPLPPRHKRRGGRTALAFRRQVQVCDSVASE